MHTLPIALGRESSAHLRTHSMNFPTCLAALSGNDALSAQLLADMPVVALAVEFGIGQHRPNRTGGSQLIKPRAPHGAVIYPSPLTPPFRDPPQNGMHSTHAF